MEKIFGRGKNTNARNILMTGHGLINRPVKSSQSCPIKTLMRVRSEPQKDVLTLAEIKTYISFLFCLKLVVWV